MSAWWLLLLLPAAYTVGVVTMSAFASRAYDNGYADGHRAGWDACRALIAAVAAFDTASGKEELS